MPGEEEEEEVYAAPLVKEMSGVLGRLRALALTPAVRAPFREMGSSAPKKKVAGGKSTGQQKGKGSKTLDGNFAVHAKVLEAKGQPKYIRDADQMAKDAEVAKTYNRNMWQRHKEHTIWLTRKIRLRDAAIVALPPELQDEANQVDMAPLPLDRHIWTDFPAIPNFNAEGEDDVKAKGAKQAKK